MQILIKNIRDFGTINLQGVHQILQNERDIENAMHCAERGGYNRVIFYVSYHAGWMNDFDFRKLVRDARELFDHLPEQECNK